MWWIILIAAIILVFMLVSSGSDSNSGRAEHDRETRQKQEYDAIVREKYEQAKIRLEERMSKIDDILSEYPNSKKLNIVVAGIYYRSKTAKELIPTLDYEDEIRLRKEPGNEYDSRAVKVMHDRIHLGYIPREHSDFVSQLIEGKKIRTIVVSSASANKVNSWDKADPSLHLIIVYDE